MSVRGAIGTLLVAVTVLAPACSNDNTLPTVAEMPTTTDPTAAADILPSPRPLPAAEIVAGLNDAISSADFCALLTAIDAAEPAASDPSGVTDVYRALSDATASARAFLPKTLKTDWEVVVVGTKEASDAVEAHDGDLTDPDVEAALQGPDMVNAIQTVERYQLDNCPPPTPPA